MCISFVNDAMNLKSFLGETVTHLQGIQCIICPVILSTCLRVSFHRFSLSHNSTNQLLVYSFCISPLVNIPFPLMQINTRLIAKLTDDYIRQKLFGKNFDPLVDNNWKILLLTESNILQHIVKNVSKCKMSKVIIIKSLPHTTCSQRCYIPLRVHTRNCLVTYFHTKRIKRTA